MAAGDKPVASVSHANKHFQQETENVVVTLSEFRIHRFAPLVLIRLHLASTPSDVVALSGESQYFCYFLEPRNRVWGW